jgi:acyl-lipid omega-6 desaturase (Delta-12 desaturase)
VGLEMRRAALWLVASTRPPLARPRLGKLSHREAEPVDFAGCSTPAQSATKLTVDGMFLKQTQSTDSTAYLFLVKNRLPFGEMRSGWRPWLGTMGTNAAIALLVVTTMSLVGVGPFLLVHLPIMLLAASMGVWLFYVQHQFENTFWAKDSVWKLHEAALHGSSHYDLPIVLRWFTANIGIHHVHHLCSRVPFYRLPRVLRDHPELRGVGRLTLLQSFACVRLALWDETQRRLISFHDCAHRDVQATRTAHNQARVGPAAKDDGPSQ